MKNNIGENLMMYRKANFLSQEKVAHYLGVAEEEIKNYEAGIQNPKLPKLLKMCNLFGVCHVEDLLVQPGLISENAIIFDLENASKEILPDIVFLKKVVGNYQKMQELMDEWGIE